MKKIYLMVIMALFAFTSCEDFLDSENYTEANTSNYPVTASDLNKELAALYGVLNQFSSDPLQTPWFVWYIMSDDANGAGGTGDVESHAIAHLMSNKDDLFDKAWHNTYVGIGRANAIIASASSMEGIVDSVRNQLLGEAFFMRGLFYLWGTQMWGDIPGYWDAAAPDPCPQQDAETVIYPHIFADFESAINLMKHGSTKQGDGHATKAAAEGFLARAYMFYEGFYKKAGELSSASLADVSYDFTQTGLPDEKLTKNDVIGYLEDAINNGGYSLVDDFRRLWQYTNELTAPDYSFVSDLVADSKYWVGNGNSEELFQVQYMNSGSWNGNIGMGFTNMTSLYCGLRCDEDANSNKNGGLSSMPFGQGWGQGTINANLWDEWSDSDPRKTATILNGCSAKNGGTQEIEVYFATSCSEETALYNKKWMPITCSGSSWDDFNKYYTWWGVYRNSLGISAPNDNSFQGDHYADVMLLRLSDIYLMHSELTGTNTYMTKVRERAGLSEIPYSWANIKAERRHELAGEGLRFNDLRRWSGKDGGTTCEAAVALEKQNGTRVNYTGTWTTMKHASSSWAQRYAETDGFLRIPPAQISNINDETVLKQNKGWGSDVSDWNMSGTPVYI